MATYKVIQDIEAEDKFLGPLTLKQFIFGAGGAFFAWLNFFAFTRGQTWLFAFFSPPMLLGFFLAFPWSKDQPTEVWVLAKLRFYFKPRRRIWDQSGMEELVTITAPPKEEKVLVDNLSKTEVKSRLRVLADTIDSRGWAIKNAQMQNIISPTDSPDRLISPGSLPKEVPIIDLASIPDVYESSNIINDFDKLMEQNAAMHKTHSLEVMDQARNNHTSKPKTHKSNFTPPVQISPPTDYTDKADYQTLLSQNNTPITNTQDERSLAEELKSRRSTTDTTSRMHRLNPIGANPIVSDNLTNSDIQEPRAPKQAEPPKPSPSAPNTAILGLASNNDLDVATIARQAKREIDKNDDNEVVISLH